jgi:hypothetical protein
VLHCCLSLHFRKYFLFSLAACFAHAADNATPKAGDCLGGLNPEISKVIKDASLLPNKAPPIHGLGFLEKAQAQKARKNLEELFAKAAHVQGVAKTYLDKIFQTDSYTLQESTKRLSVAVFSKAIKRETHRKILLEKINLLLENLVVDDASSGALASVHKLGDGRVFRFSVTAIKGKIVALHFEIQLEGIDQAQETLFYDIRPDVWGTWSGVLSHYYLRSARHKESFFHLDKKKLNEAHEEADVPLPRKQADAQSPFELEAKNDRAFVEEVFTNIRNQRGTFKSILFVPPPPKKGAKNEKKYADFYRSFAPFAIQVKFSSYREMNKRLKELLTIDLALSGKVSEILVDSMVDTLEVNMPVLFFVGKGKKALLDPIALESLYLPHKVDPLLGLQGAFADFIDHFDMEKRLSSAVQESIAESREIDLKLQEQDQAKSEPLSVLPPVVDLAIPVETAPDQSVLAQQRVDQMLAQLAQSQGLVAQQAELLKSLQEELAALKQQSEDQKRESAEALALELAGSEIQAAKERQKELEQRLAQSLAHENALLAQLRARDRSGDISAEQLAALRAVEARGFRSVQNAVDFALALHPGSVALTPQALKQISNLESALSYEPLLAQEIYGSLVSLWHVFWGPNAPRDIVAKERMFREMTGLEISFRESKETMNHEKAAQERGFYFEGKEYFAWPHVKLTRVNHDRRIYFAVDSENRRIIIASWPHHLWISSR